MTKKSKIEESIEQTQSTVDLENRVNDLSVLVQKLQQENIILKKLAEKDNHQISQFKQTVVILELNNEELLKELNRLTELQQQSAQ